MSSFTCPNCKQQFSEKSEAFPFCSKRCKLLDLGAWASERYRIAGKPAQSEDLEQAQEQENAEEN